MQRADLYRVSAQDGKTLKDKGVSIPLKTNMQSPMLEFRLWFNLKCIASVGVGSRLQKLVQTWKNKKNKIKNQENIITKTKIQKS